MPITAQSADGVNHEFPDGTAPEIIDKAMKSYATQAQPQQAKPLAPQPQGPTPPGTPSNPIRIQSMKTPEQVYQFEHPNDVPGPAPDYGKFFKSLGTPQGRDKAMEAIAQVPGQMISGIVGLPKRAIQTAEQAPMDSAAQVGPAFDIASLLALGKMPIKAPTAALKPALDALKVHLSPDTLSPEGEAAGGAIRQAQGTRFRDTASTAAALEPFHKIVNALPETARMAFIDHVEGGNVQPMSGPLTDLAKVLRDAAQKREAKLSALPGKEKMEFVKDYLAHFWQDPKALEKIDAAGSGEPAETITSAASKIGGKIYEGPNHFLAIQKAAKERGEDVMDTLGTFNTGEFKDGFVTSKGRFVDRAEADRIATASGQKQTLAPGARKASEGLGHTELKQTIQRPASRAGGGGQGKQGSAASLKKRVVPTYAAGIAAGLKPLTSDPIEITMRYVRSMDRYIAAQEVLEAAKANGTIRYVKPQTMGASGHPEGFQPPEGWVPIQGRGATSATGEQAYAPADFARVYNNFVSRGFHDINEDLGNAVDKLQHASNSITGFELGLSAYHALNVATSAVISDVGRGISNIVGGRPLKGLTAMGRAFTAPVTSYLRGRKLEQVYLGRSQGTPDWRKVIDIATKAGSRGAGKRHASDYEFSAMGSYWTSIKRGAFKQEMAQSWQNVKDRPIRGGAGELFHLVGRAMETLSKPLFEDYIPRVKNAALYDLIKDWVEANPQATAEEQVRVARKMVDAMDDRFGEMIQDNLFVNKALKQSAQIGMRSYSWTLGLFRQLARTAGDPRRLSIKHPDYNPALAATLAGAITIPLINAVYQKLKTGKDPESVQDVMAPRTGGQVPGFAGRGQVPERAMLPSHERDIFGWWYDPKQEAINKQARFMEMIEEGVSGKDWADRPYMNPDASTEMQVMQWLEHLGSALVPISVGTLEQGHKKGSTLGTGAAVSGVREAPKYLEDPEGYKRGMTIIHRNAYKRGQKSIRKQQSQYQGAQE